MSRSSVYDLCADRGHGVEGAEAIAKARAVMGATNSPEAAPGTIRKEYGTTTATM